MSGAYEGGFMALIDSKKVWSYDANHQDCPFDDIGFGESVFALYGLASRLAVPDPGGPEPAEARQERIDALVKRQEMIELDVSEPIPSGFVHLEIDEKEGIIRGIFSTTRENGNQLDENSCILLNISLDSFKPKEDIDSTDLTKILSTLKTQHAFRNRFPLQIKKLDQTRLETLNPKADLQENSECRERAVWFYHEIHVVLKFSRSGYKTERGWNKGQQLMGNKLLAEGLLSDFAIKAEGKTIPCQRVFLAGRNAVFAVTFASNRTEVEKGTLMMVDMSAEGVEGFLKYVYTGSLVDAMANSTIAFEMLRAGHKYKIEDLEFVCKEILESAKSESFDAVTAFEMFQYGGNVEGLAALQTKAVRVLKENAKQFQETGEIGTLLESIQSADVRKVFNDWMCRSLQCT